ncbi:MAG: sulfatase-like hydrolase/transferase, partial [Planctomycetota bacterium]|nr:sulfatase-like hydrolase/transferase [Planctomycetota bacterium]
PFFINLWIHEPHTPFHTVPKYEWRFRNLERPDQIYASVLSHADDRIGQVLQALDDLKIADSTLVIFSSDNGPARAASPTELDLQYDTATGAGWGIGAAKGLTGGRKGYKSALFEGGIGVPFIARWPGKIASANIDRTSMISAVDLLPTFCELAGADLPDNYSPDGVSQVQAILGKATTLHEVTREKPLFWKMQSRWPIREKQPYHWVSYAVVKDQWKLLTNGDGSYVELYNMADDPMEADDLKTRHIETVQQLQRELNDWQQTLPDHPTGNVFSAERDGSSSQ